MPRKRKKRKEVAALSRAKNIVRGAKNPSTALALVIRSVPPGNTDVFLNWAESVPLRGHTVLPEAFPRRLSNILRRAPPPAGEIADDLHLICCRLRKHRGAITAFLRLRNDFEAALHRSDYLECLNVLDAHREQLGYSLWWVELKLAVTAWKDGLEAQKTLSKTIDGGRHKSLLAVIVHFASQRNEHSTSFNRFETRMRTLVDGSRVSSGTKLFYKYRLIGEVPSAIESAQQLLIYESMASLPDTYEMFVQLAIAAATELLDGPNAILLDAICSEPLAQDDRLAKIRFILGNQDDSSLKTRKLHWDHCLLTGAASLPTGACDDDRSDFRAVWLEALARIGIQPPANEQLDSRGLLLAAAYSTLSELETASQSSGILAKWSANFRTDTVASSISCLADGYQAAEAPFPIRRQLLAALGSQFLDPWDLPFLPHDSRRRYLNALRQRYGDSLVVRYATWLAGLEDNDALEGLSDECRQFGHAFRKFSAREFKDAAAVSQLLIARSRFRIPAIRWYCNAKLELQLERDVIQFAAGKLAESSGYQNVLPLQRLIGNREWTDLRQYSNEVGLAVILDFYWRQTGKSELNSYRRYAAEDFLESRGMDKPSDLAGHLIAFDRHTIIYFLANVCVPEVLDLMLALPSSKSVHEERRTIYSLLAEFDPDNASSYREGIEHITRALIVDEGIRLVDQSRVFVDVEAVIRWAEQNLQESFDRYSALHKAGVGFDQAEFAVAVRKFIETQQPIPEQFLVFSKNEADTLLLEMISKVRDNFLLSPTHGLDAYLSMRVRHGTLSGMLRGPLEQAFIINQRQSGTLRYQRNTHWESVLSGCPVDNLRHIEDAIAAFSDSYDKTIDDLRNRLQIRRKDKPSGFFEITLTVMHVYMLKSWFAEGVRIQEFVRTCAALFWLMLDGNLNEIRCFISENLKRAIAGLFEELERETRRATQGIRYQPLSDAIRVARTDVQGVIDNIAGWFQRTASSRLKYPIGQAVEIALEVVRITYRRFAPQITTTLETADVIIIDSVTVIGDIIFTALDNVYRHSGIDSNPRVWINVARRDQGYIQLTIESELHETFDRVAAEEKLAAIRGRLAQQDYRTTAVVGEGGTGLMKLKTLVDPNGMRSDALTFEVTESGRFRVRVILKTIGLEREDISH